jgi:hypothetical protein
MGERRTIDLELTLDGHRVQRESSYTWAGAHLLVLHSLIPRPDRALRLQATFIGQCGVPTRAAHMVLGPPGQPPQVVNGEQLR